MPALPPRLVTQMQDVLAALGEVLGNDLLALYLHGSATAALLRPRSDLDLLAVTAAEPTAGQRRRLLAALLRLSVPYPAPADGPRCLDLALFVRADLGVGYPPRAAFVYGEWLRADYEAGQPPDPFRSPDHVLVLEQARQTALPLHGPAATDLLPAIPAGAIRRAMHDVLPPLLAELDGDERNVLLTLARLWHTAATGDFVAKDVAAAWAMPQLAAPDSATLDLARRGYLEERSDDWSHRGAEASALASDLRRRIEALL